MADSPARFSNRARTTWLALFAACCMTLGTAPIATASPDTVLPVLSVEQMRDITGIPELTTVADHGDSATPAADPDTPEPCRAVYDDPIVFGTDWTQFRSVFYHAYTAHPIIVGIASVTQTVAVYPDAGTAQKAFDRIVAAAPACSTLQSDSGYYHRDLQHPDPNTLILNGDMVTDGFRVVGNTVLGVSTLVPSELPLIDAQNLLNRLQAAGR